MRIEKTRVRVAGSAAMLLSLVASTSLGPRGMAFAQTQVFEAASVKPVDPNRRFAEPMEVGPSRFRAVSVPLSSLIQMAYGVRPFQISGGPSWIKSEWFDVEAKVGGSADEHQIWQMVQTLLADRFQLKLHRETKEMSVYALMPGKNGPKLAEAKQAATCGFGKGCIQVDFGSLQSRGASAAVFAEVLTSILGEPVLDKSGLDRNYDFKLTYDQSTVRMPLPGVANDPTDGPSIFVAVQEQLGLKLESQKDPVEVLVIDHAEKPNAN